MRLLIKYALDEVFEKYIQYLNSNTQLSKATINRYRSAISSLVVWLKDTRLIENFEEIKLDDLLDFLSKPNEMTGMVAKAGTRAVTISSIRNLYKWAINNDLVSSDVSWFIKSPNVSEQMPEILLLEDAIKLEKTSIQRKFSSRDYLITLLLLLRGLRVSELVSLDINKVNFKNGTIIFTGKGGNIRTLYLTNKLIVALNQYIPERNAILVRRNRIHEQALFISEKLGKRLTQRGVQLIIDEIAQMANVKTIDTKKISPNKLRHTCASMLYNDGNGANISDIAELLGHKDKYSANKYAKLRKETNISPSIYSTNPLELT
ncbi:site-specific tyrosine recombinase XerD [Paenibacillus elgii]|uniref:tyrosine-type recombinase/integrase n=1 Tax=Paenibacillus elgii TaxID=189691 RepID=UPI002D7B73FA|nr:site-specific tyrosine recombinase XerD [Paenibacillus elgii]